MGDNLVHIDDIVDLIDDNIVDFPNKRRRLSDFYLMPVTIDVESEVFDLDRVEELSRPDAHGLLGLQTALAHRLGGDRISC